MMAAVFVVVGFRMLDVGVTLGDNKEEFLIGNT
jgi:hypothetical protein